MSLRLSCVLAIVLLLGHMAPATAQHSVQPLGAGEAHLHASGLAHHCVQLWAAQDGRASLAAYETARSEGRLLAAAKTRQALALDDTMTFNVRTNIQLDVSEHEWEKITFVLKAEEPVIFTRPDNSTLGFRIWVEVDEWTNGHVGPDDVEKMRVALKEQTSENSIDPNTGILENSDRIFGRPPNFDGDGIVDFLLTDVIEGTSGNGTNTLGFFDPNDINPGAPASRTNQRDMLYIDTSPGITGDRSLGTVLATLAHEHQHLIHAEWDIDEATFVNEALSEVAPVLWGFNPINPPGYLGNGSSGYNVNLMKWDGLTSDYARGGLLMSYLVEQFGAETTGSITRNSLNGAPGIDVTLQTAGADRTFEEALLDFHTANVVGDPSLDPRFGYTSPVRAGVGITSPFSYNGGSATSTSPSPIGRLKPGGVEYVVWRNVKDFELQFDVVSGAADRLGLRVLLERAGGGGEVVDLPAGVDEPHFFSGEYDRITLIVVQTATRFGDAEVGVTAEWTSTAVRFVETIYDDNTWESFFLIGSSQQTAYATRFSLPEGEDNVQLSRVFLPNYYMSQLQGGPPPESPRDFRFAIWAADATGNPGQELFSLEMEDPRVFEGILGSDPLKFVDLDLRPYQDQLPVLPQTFYLGASNLGVDINNLVVPVSDYRVENLTFVTDPQSTGAEWREMWSIQLSGGDDLNNHIVAVRTEFMVGGQVVPVEPGAELPQAVTLAQNYPNPFNPRTRIDYVLPQTGPVRLAVYDLLGREVAVLIDETRPAGAHSVTFDMAGRSSGLYVYVLEAGDTRLNRKMTLLR